MKFTIGTREYMVVEITEVLGEILTLDLATITFDVYDSTNETLIVDNSSSVLVDGLQIRCLIEPDEDWEPDEYYLYVKINGLPSDEQPRLGPIPFTVIK